MIPMTMLLMAGGCAVHDRAAISDLNQQLLAADSATLTLEKWCRSRGLADPAQVHVVKLDDAAPPLSDAQRKLLEIGPDEPVGYRHVRLTCGGHALSDAQNWFVPSRLSAEMRQTLATTDTPYGRVIRPLDPTRVNSSIPVRADDPLGTLFHQRGLVKAGDGRPLALVEERYLPGLLGK